jgi:Cys-tRNA(Pro) deacylase
MSFSSSVTRALDELGLPYRVFHHPGPVRSLEQAAEERGQRPEQVVRSILFRLAQDRFALVLVAGPAQVSWPALRSYLGQSRLTMASEAEVLAVTGYPIGAVSPLGVPRPLRVLVDQGICQQEEVSIGSGERYVAVILRTEDLVVALKSAEIGKFVVGGNSSSD